MPASPESSVSRRLQLRVSKDDRQGSSGTVSRTSAVELLSRRDPSSWFGQHARAAGTFGRRTSRAAPWIQAAMIAHGWRRSRSVHSTRGAPSGQRNSVSSHHRDDCLAAALTGQALEDRDGAVEAPSFRRAVEARHRGGQPAFAALPVLAKRGEARLGELDQDAAPVDRVRPAARRSPRPGARRPSAPSTAAAPARRRQARSSSAARRARAGRGRRPASPGTCSRHVAAARGGRARPGARSPTGSPRQPPCTRLYR